MEQTKRELTPEEITYIKEAQAIGNVVDTIKYFVLYNSIFGTNNQPCQCSGIIKDMMVHFDLIIQRDYEKD